jgi:hypothetical protein
MGQVVIEGQQVVVELAKDRQKHEANMGVGNKPKSHLRITISNIEGPVSWQDLKDWARVCGNVNFANVFNGKDGEKVGVIEYEKEEEFESALTKLEDEPLKGHHVKVAKVRDVKGGEASVTLWICIGILLLISIDAFVHICRKSLVSTSTFAQWVLPAQ